MKKNFLILSFCCITFFVAYQASAATRYVATTGSDSSNNCSTSGSPCATISRCVSQMAAGDTCTVADGTYTDQAQASASFNCTSQAPCTIKSTNPLGAILVFTSSGPASYQILINGNNWVIDGFKVQENYQRGFVQDIGTTGLTFKNNRVEISPYYGESALYVTGTSNVTIQNNWVHHYPGCVNDAVRCASGGYDSCDFVEDPAGASFLDAEFNINGAGGSNIVITGNDYGHMRNPMSVRNYTTVTYSRNKCTNATNHGCIEGDDLTGVVMENNIADIDTGPGCTDGSEVYQSSLWDSYCSANVIIRNNTSVGQGLGWAQQLVDLEPNHGAASACGDSAGPNVCANGGCFQSYSIYNNIVYDGANHSGWFGFTGGTAGGLSGTQPRYRTNYNDINDPSGPCIGAYSNSTYCSWSQWQAADIDGDGTPEDVNGINSVPQFVSYAGHDYHAVSAAAPQVNAGGNSGIYACPSVDYDGNPRNDGQCDIGAFEVQAAAAGDSQAPTAPTNLSASVTVASVIRSWFIAIVTAIARLF